tara:strand:+ start:1938 stop:2297 length:360 start_codon:yes stop_codon:yes gene_type:complete
MTLQYFKKQEFQCKCGCKTNQIDGEFLEMMDEARRYAGVPFKINSGYRCPQHPLSKKNPTSSHIKGIAADIKFTDGKNLAFIIAGLVAAGFERFGLNFDSKFVHVDYDQEKVSPCFWGY